MLGYFSYSQAANAPLAGLQCRPQPQCNKHTSSNSGQHASKQLASSQLTREGPLVTRNNSLLITTAISVGLLTADIISEQ